MTVMVTRKDGVTQRSANAAKTSCAQGHPFTPENTSLRTLDSGPRKGQTRRVCKVCERLRRALVRNMERYGLSQERYLEMYRAQDGRCKICSRALELGTRQVQVDHCHATGKVRGLLCRDCNMALGCVKDNPETLRAMLAYLLEEVAR